MFEAIHSPQRVIIRMSAVRTNIDLAALEAKKLLLRHDLGKQTFAILLGMHETLSNAVIHGSGEDPNKHVECALSVNGGDITLSVEDSGPGFDWRQVEEDVPGTASTSGRGRAILNHYFDTICYNEQGNKVVLTKHCSKGVGMSTISQDGTQAIIIPGNDIVASMAKDFREELKHLIDAGVQSMTIDLAGVEMIDSIGMGLLIAAHNSISKYGNKLKLVNSTQDILGLLRTMRLDKHFDIAAI